MYKKQEPPYLPPLATWLLSRLTRAGDRDDVLGDLAEEFTRVRVPLAGLAAARRWYWRQALRSIVPLSASRAAGLPPREGKMGNLLQDLRYGLRTLAKSPSFTLLTVGTLGLAIGVNTAIFSMLNVVLLRPLPIRDPDGVAFIYTTNPDRGIERDGVSPGDFVDLRRETRSFAQLGALNRGASFVLTGWDEPVRLAGFGVTANVFDIWRIPALLGRTFREGEDRPGAEHVAMLAHRCWKERFGGDPDVVGQTVYLDGDPTTIIGVVPPEVELGSLATREIWVPMQLSEAAARRDVRSLWVTGRLRDGVTVAQARQEIEAAGKRLAAEHRDEAAGWRLTVFDMNRTLAPQQTWTLLFLLALTVGLVMLIACSNVATMMLTRAAARGRELAVRAALGAGRRRILGQLLAESTLLAGAAAALGLVLARIGIWTLVWMAGDNSGITGFMRTLTIDRNVLLFVLLIGMLAPLLFGLAPALRASRPDLVDALKEGGRGNSGARLGGRRLLVAGQVSLALALMVVAGITLRAMIDQRILDPGFDTRNLLTMRLELPESRYAEPQQWIQFFDAVQQRLEALPQVRDVALMQHRYAGEFAPIRNFTIENKPEPRPDEIPWATVSSVAAGAVRAMGLPILSGRGLEPTDNADARPVALINADAAERFWPGEDPLGQRIRIAGDAGGWREVVGVMASLRIGDPENPTFPIVYVPYLQSPAPAMGVFVRTTGPPLDSARAIRAAVWEIDGDQPLGDVRTVRQLIDDAYQAGETLLSIFVFFAVFAILMAGAGIYGVVAFAVTQRTQEIGIRMALGAQRTDVLGLVAKFVVGLVAFGLVVGLAAGIGLGRVATSALPGYEALDPLVLVTVAAVLVCAAALAAWLPARRAARIDPILALRAE